MKIARTLPELIAHRDALRASHGRLALVPTMGALHAGHMALVREAGRHGAGVITSIFVNPTQFNAADDLARYPRDEAGDLEMLRGGGCHLVWLPDAGTMYPPGDATVVEVSGPSHGWEGAVRPGHFRGVATVCAKLFGQVRADAALFGEKDWQQVRVVTRMVRDLSLPLSIVPIPTVREVDGLALSSRNRFLTEAERQIAPALYEALDGAAAAIAEGAAVADMLAAARTGLAARGFGIDYFDLVDSESLDRLDTCRPPARLIAAARLGSVRLLDNVPVV